MNANRYLNFIIKYKLKIIGTSLTLIIALLLDSVIFPFNTGLCLLSAYLILMNDKNLPFRQHLLITVTMICSAILADSILFFLTPNSKYLLVLLACIFCMISLFYLLFNLLKISRFYYGISFFIIFFLVFSLKPLHHIDLFYKIIAILSGSVLSLFTARLFFYRDIYSDFSSSLLPYVKNLYQLSKDFHWQSASDQIQLKTNNDHLNILLKYMYERRSMYPNWVYEVGFNPGLRAGFRYHLIQFERIIDLYLEMNLAASRCHDLALISPYIERVYTGNITLLNILILYFEEKYDFNVEIDFEKDILDLRHNLKLTLMGDGQFIDLYPADLAKITLVEAICDIRKILLSLCLGLPRVRPINTAT